MESVGILTQGSFRKTGLLELDKEREQARFPNLRDSYQFRSSSRESLSLRNLAVNFNKLEVRKVGLPPLLS